MLDLEFSIPEAHEPTDQLETARNKVISTIMADVSVAFPDIPYVGAHPTVNEQCIAWQEYAQNYAAAGRALTIAELGSDSRLIHPSSGNLPDKLASFTLGLINSELSLRADAYEAVLPKQIVSHTALSELDEKRIHANVASDWDLLQPEYQHSVKVLGQLTARVLRTHALVRLPQEKEILVTEMQKEAEAVELSLTPHR